MSIRAALTGLFLMISLPATGTVRPGSPWENLASRFKKEIRIGMPRVQKILYGHPQLGYFPPEAVRRVGNNLLATIIPPTYKHPVHILGFKKGRWIRLKNRRFRSPLPPAFNLIRTSVTGRFTSPFYLLSGSLPRSRFRAWRDATPKPDMPMKNRTRFTFPMVVNAFGEIVWTWVPRRDQGPLGNYVVFKRTGPGNFGILLGKETSLFQTVRWDGRLLKNLSIRTFNSAVPLHHEFVQFNGKSFLSLGYDARSYESSKSYLTSTVARVDLARSTVTILKDFGDYFHVGLNKWQEEKNKTHFVHWDKANADHDFTHANGILPVDQGYLISFRHLNRVALVKKDWKMAWTLGPDKDNDIVATGGAAFSFQHSPFFRGPNKLVLFDNGFRRKKSRIVGLRIEGKKAVLDWQFPAEPMFYAKDRGSVSPLPSGNLLAFFVDPKILGKKRPKMTRSDYMIEFHPEKGREVARMKILFFTKSPGYRALPLQQIGRKKSRLPPARVQGLP